MVNVWCVEIMCNSGAQEFLKLILKLIIIKNNNKCIMVEPNCWVWGK
jgi:hypothetical protein